MHAHIPTPRGAAPPGLIRSDRVCEDTHLLLAGHWRSYSLPPGTGAWAIL
jgi:hypothetical protein